MFPSSHTTTSSLRYLRGTRNDAYYLRGTRNDAYHYTLEPDPELPFDSPAPKERLVFAFSTADVVVFGVRLSFLMELLREHKLAAVWPIAERYANLEPSQPCVTGITVRLLENNPGK